MASIEGNAKRSGAFGVCRHKCMASTEENVKRSGAFEVCKHMCMIAQRKMQSEVKHLESVNRQGTGPTVSEAMGPSLSIY